MYNFKLSLLPSAHTAQHLKTSLEEELEEESTLIAFLDLIWGILALPLHTVHTTGIVCDNYFY